jgi:hypothetical protein
MQPRASRTVRDSNSPNQPVWLWGQESSVVRTQQRKISNASTLTILGYLDQAHSRLNEALAASRQLGHPYTTGAVVAQVNPQLVAVRNGPVARSAERGKPMCRSPPFF